ncbi:hypothetical protein [Streptomyces sp. NPDC058308]|uniref:hypothetical protein n=1 Tax=Streptomyces sp. NPDC058308 TaxID=3346440 RepID=UPI0036EEA66D
MAKSIAVKGDSVRGTDTHKVSGTLENGTTPYVGLGKYAYQGSITKGLSDFVRINGVPVALVTSGSTLDAGQTAPGPPPGGHAGPAGSDFVPAAPKPLATSLSILDIPLGGGTPGASAGSGLLTIGGVKVLLDKDVIDTCSGLPTPGESKVSAQQQSLVACSQ